MKALSWIRARPKTLASAAGVTVGVIALTTMALTYEGFPTTKVDLNDGGVWITKTSSLLVGHFNHESTVLDGGLRTVSEDYDILQDTTNVLVVDQAGSTVTAIDPARVSLGDTTAIPSSAKVALGANTAAIRDQKSGDLWVVPVQGLAGFEIEAAEPLAELGDGSDVTVATDGTVFALSGERGEVVTVPVDKEGAPQDSSTASVGDIDVAEQPTITAVGSTPVVLDAAAGAVMTPGGFRTEVAGAQDAVLQHASAKTDAVALATPTALVRVPLDGGEPSETSAGAPGAAAAPVSLRGCTYGAWAGSATFIRECPGDKNDVDAPIEGAESSLSLTFRVNRDVIILNDAVGGAAWLANESLQRVDNWNDLTPPEGETENEDDSTEETVETTLPERSEQNTPPIAEDDTYGVRPGATTLLPVLDNDNDPDGDVLVATLAEKQPSIGTVQAINNGGALQIAVDEKASGSSTFSYEVDDGRGGKDTAQVTLTVRDWNENDAPKSKRKTSLAVETGGTISYNILPDWIDPDGDDIYLKEIIPAAGDEVDFSKDGQITYKATASLQGRKDLQVTVADASGETGSATIALDVRPQGSTSPKTNADHVITRAGEQVTVAPLVNDTSTGREPLRLSRVLETAGATIHPDTPNKTFTFSAEKTGVYYVQYQVTTGPKNGEGLVRVDVMPESESDLPPVAVRDVALLPTGGDVLLGVLNNDTDPAGGILVVQSVTLEPGSGISVSVLNHETLRITDQGALDEPVRLQYRISNGAMSADGEVVVIPIPAPTEILQPIANPDSATVRVGDVVTIPVLDNDTHPSDDVLHVEPELIEPFVDPEDGEAFVSQDAVRFRAGPEAKTVYLTYEASDSRQQKAAGYVTIQILPVDEETNAAPRPQDITARALSGTEVNIAVPLDGLDADGDSVELIGIDSSPTKGRITTVGPNYFTYEAAPEAAGVDVFKYRVRDRLGKEGVATIRVGIAPAEEINQPPYAVKDAVVVRPGREIAVPVMENDSDPEGDKLALVEDGLELPENLEGRVSGDRVLVTAPNEEVETSLQYTVSDARGATATATLQVTVDDDVPLQAPVARDDRLQPADLEDGSLSADLEILKNDEDPDGTKDKLDVEVGAGGTLLENGKVRVTVTDELQLVRYTLTDPDGLQASAFVFVPSRDGLRPTLTSTKPLEVISGETETLPLSEYVTVAGGGDVTITEKAKVSANHADGADLLKDASTLEYTSAEGYFGPDALTFEVTDGDGPDDPEGRKATLSIPINVLPPDNQPPTFVQGQVNVAPGEEATPLDLAALTDDPDPEDKGKHDYSLVGGEGRGISARIDGDRLFVEASSNADKGATATLTIRVSDGETEPVEGTVTALVTASTRSMPAANTDTVSEADAGEPITVPALANDFNPFPDTPLTIVSAVTESGRGEVSFTTDEVTVTPAEGFVGTLVVRYRIQDATEDVDREVNGQIVVTVQDVPAAPGVPIVASVQDRTVVVSYSAPSNNGAEITKYTVTSVGGSGYTKECQSTTCTLDGLTNNVEYTFQVTATNRVGDSEPSRASEVARPDARPDTPNPPTLEFGDKSLKVAWATPSTPGSPVDRYTLEISPAPPSGITQKEVTGNSLTWEGLENGSDYQVRVQAHNRAPDPSSWSGWSSSMIPAGPPLASGAPSTQELSPVDGQAQMQVSWSPPNNNGDSIRSYQLQVLRGGQPVNTITPGPQETSQAVVVETSETAYTYRIRAQNKAGWGEWSAQSAPRRGVIPPGAPTSLRVTQEGDRFLDIAFNAGSSGGASSGEIRYEYRLGGGQWQGVPGDKRIGGLDNGGKYTVEVRAVATVSGSTYAGAPSNRATGSPHGTPHAPGTNAESLYTQVRLHWNASGSANGRDIDLVQISIDGGGWQDAALYGTIDVGNGHNETHSIKARARDTSGAWSPESPVAQHTSQPPPTPRAWVTRGQAVSNSQCNDGTCAKFVINTQHFPAGNYAVSCNSDAPAGHRFSSYRSVAIPANGQVALSCFHGYGGRAQVWVTIGGTDYERTAW
ncbi:MULTISPECIES: Ig-like domain-containing protein [unclassified Microbacterium]|uniref:Ig-like domain-containing protein n=1 Tax=unclassified Microbacterium TaxID=2609290 RepID=UPI000EAA8785|nr:MULTISPECIES: Ig-like domain-containing protein [unclassified Microbacterium]MBT2484522.1 tandem-95 repeat protein [Microbacterium sp. ISL-108]RKN67423.1 tandem-95 repeat protein [Microbacterium sp. CGR2]